MSAPAAEGAPPESDGVALALGLNDVAEAERGTPSFAAGTPPLPSEGVEAMIGGRSSRLCRRL